MSIVITRSDGLRIRVSGIGVDGDLIGEVIDNAGAILTVRRLSLVEVDAYNRAQQSGKPEMAVIQHHNGAIKTSRYYGVHGRRYDAPQRKSLRSNNVAVSHKLVEVYSRHSIRIGDRHYHFSKGLY